MFRYRNAKTLVRMKGILERMICSWHKSIYCQMTCSLGNFRTRSRIAFKGFFMLEVNVLCYLFCIKLQGKKEKGRGEEPRHPHTSWWERTAECGWLLKVEFTWAGLWTGRHSSAWHPKWVAVRSGSMFFKFPFFFWPYTLDSQPLI